MTTIGPERLHGLTTLAALGMPVLARLAGVTHHQLRPPGATVFAQHDESRDVYLVLRGHLRIISYSAAGREVVLHDLHPGDLVGELSALDGAPRGASLVTVTEAELGRIEVGAFNRLLDEEPAFARLVLGRLTRLIRSLNRRIGLLAAPLAARISAELLRLAEHHRTSDNSARLCPPPKHVDLANRINTHREAVSRTLAELQRRAIISRSRSELVIHDLGALSAHAAGLPLPPRPAVSGRTAPAASPAQAAASAQKR